MIIIVNSINFILTDCPDGYLYCYNNKKELLGKILVNECWTWLRFSCQPCSASTDKLMITYDKYIHQCRHYYPTANEILAWDHAEIAKFASRFRLIG
jgi:hypothetical protein